MRLYRKSPKLTTALERLAVMKEAPPSADVLASLPRDFYEVTELKYEQTQPLEEELRAFARCVQEKGEPAVPGEHGVRAMKVAEQVLAEVRGHTWK